MQTSDISATNPLGREHGCFPTGPTGGFTLLELIVVLVLMGSITALALPNLSNLYATLGRNTERDQILDELSALGQKAWSSQTNLVLYGSDEPDQDGDSELASRSLFDRKSDSSPQEGEANYANFEQPEFDLPVGWKLQLEQPLRVLANGVCLGTEVTLTHDSGYEYRTTLVAPYCREQAHEPV